LIDDARARLSSLERWYEGEVDDILALLGLSIARSSSSSSFSASLALPPSWPALLPSRREEADLAEVRRGLTLETNLSSLATSLFKLLEAGRLSVGLYVCGCLFEFLAEEEKNGIFVYECVEDEAFESEDCLREWGICV